MFSINYAEEAEKAYWEKINADRVARFNSKREKKRGTEKVGKQSTSFPFVCSFLHSLLSFVVVISVRQLPCKQRFLDRPVFLGANK